MDGRQATYLSANYILELHKFTRYGLRTTTILYIGPEVYPEHLEVDLVYWLHVWQPREGVGVINNPVDDGGVSSCPTKRVGIECFIVFCIGNLYELGHLFMN